MDRLFKASIILLVMLIPSILYSAFVLTVLWTWFVVPLGVPAITIPVAFGLGLVVAHFKTIETKNHTGKSQDELAAEMEKAIVSALIKPSMLLVLGWLCTLFM